MKTRYMFTAVATVAVLALTLFAADKVDLEGIKCANNGKAAAKDVEGSSVDYKGGKVYFCCANCPKAFTAKVVEADKPDELLAARGNAQLVATKQATQAKCVFTGGPLKTKLTVNGATVQFCCENCLGKAKKMEGEDQLVALFGDKAFEKGAFKVGKDEKKDKE